MGKKIKAVVTDQVYQATYHMLTNKIPLDADINNYVEEIYLQALKNVATHFLDTNKLRKSERNVLELFQQDCAANKELYVIEQNLYRNLQQVKPVWGEFFGRDRGDIYNAFVYLQRWPCFSMSLRYRIKVNHLKNLQRHTEDRDEKLHQKTQQLEHVGTSLKRYEQTTGKVAQRSASQFIEIQQLKMENQELRERLQKAENRIQQQTSVLKASGKTDAAITTVPITRL